MVAEAETALTGQSMGFMEKNHFLLRRLHSLTGIVPIGMFLIAHLVTNSSIVWGVINKRGAIGVEYRPEEEGFARRVGTTHHEVGFINEMPFLILIEIGLWSAIAFHSILGFYYARSGKSNLQRYAFQDNWRYSLQRWSGYIGFLFVLYHVGTLRWGWTFLTPGGTEWSHHYAVSTTAAILRGTPWDDPVGISLGGVLVSLFYMLGVTMLVFHFANGLWTAAITWGVTVTQRAQRQWGLACAGLGAGLMLAGWSSVIGFMVTDVDLARQVEVQLLEKKGLAEYAADQAKTEQTDSDDEQTSDSDEGSN